MIPFYYKGILFYEDAPHSVYARGIAAINDLSFEIRNEKNVRRMLDSKADVSLTMSILANRQYSFIAELTRNSELFCIYDMVNSEFAYPSADNFLRLMPTAIEQIPYLMNKYAAAANRGEIQLPCNLLSPTIDKEWQAYKEEISHNELDNIQRTYDAKLLHSYREIAFTPGDLTMLLQIREENLRSQQHNKDESDDLDLEK